jgi:uncharacterized membrane protein YeiH
VLRQSELYVTACVAGIALYFLLSAWGLPEEWAESIGIVVIAVIRIASIWWRITLPVAKMPER